MTKSPFRLSGPESVDGRCYQQWLAASVGRVAEGPLSVQAGAGNFIRTWLMTAYPVGPVQVGKIDQLLRVHAQDPHYAYIRLRLTYHLRPADLPGDLAARWRRRRQVAKAAETGILSVADHDAADAAKAYDQLHAAAHKRDALLELWVALTAVAPDSETLNRLEQRLRQACSVLSMQMTPLFKEQLDGLALSHALGTRATGLLQTWPGHVSHAQALSYHLPFLHGSIGDGQGCYVGHELDDLGNARACYVDFMRGTGPMVFVVAGMSGSGKSTWIKAMSVGLILQGFRVIVYDANNEYKALAEAVGGITVDMTAASGLYYEPLQIPLATGDPDYDRDRLLRTVHYFRCVLQGLVPDITPEERACAERLVLATYEEVGIDRNRPDTWDRPVSVHDWHRLLCEDTAAPAVSLRSKLFPYFEGAEQLFRTAARADWGSARFIRVLISERANNRASDERLAAVKMLLVNQQVWHFIVQAKVRREFYTMVWGEEAQRVLHIPEMSDLFYQLGTDSRKYNAGIGLACNDIHAFFETRGGRGIWENASLYCLFRMKDSGLNKAAGNVRLSPAVVEHLRKITHYEFLLSRDQQVWTRARLNLPEREMALYATRGLG